MQRLIYAAEGSSCPFRPCADPSLESFRADKA